MSIKLFHLSCITRIFKVGTGWAKLEVTKATMCKIGQFTVISSLAEKCITQKKFLHYVCIFTVALISFSRKRSICIKKLSNKFTAVHENPLRMSEISCYFSFTLIIFFRHKEGPGIYSNSAFLKLSFAYTKILSLVWSFYSNYKREKQATDT